MLSFSFISLWKLPFSTCIIYGILFLHVITSRGCFCQKTLFSKNGLDLLPWTSITIQWRYNKRNGVSHHRQLDCLVNRLFRRRKHKNQSSASLAFVCEGNPSVTGGFPSQRASNADLFPFGDVIMISNFKLRVTCGSVLSWPTDSPRGIWSHEWTTSLS